uniref:Uncharacterized protein n=1 Tax=Macaca fascicularis TaxID=9541 RepID=Q9BGW8_MACFA|nr:hypothetical protein [Macaca fascicularis]
MGDADVPRHMLHHSGCATKRHPGACGPMWSLSQREAVSRAKVPTASTGLRNGPEKSGQGNMFLARPARPARGTYRRVCLPAISPAGTLRSTCPVWLEMAADPTGAGEWENTPEGGRTEGRRELSECR